MQNNIEIFKKCIREKDFFFLVYFITDKCSTEEELIDICKHSNNITLDMIADLINSASEYIDRSSNAVKAAKRIIDSGVLSEKTKALTLDFIERETDSTYVMAYRLQYFLKVIKDELV